MWRKSLRLSQGQKQISGIDIEWKSPKALTASESVGDVSTLRPDFHWLLWGGRVCPKGRDSGQTQTQKDAAVPSNQRSRALWDPLRELHRMMEMFYVLFCVTVTQSKLTSLNY